MKELIKELFKMEELHQSYQDNECEYTVDSTKNGNTLTIKVTMKENTDKKDFEKWTQTIDDDIFQEIMDSLEGTNFGNLYNSDHYKEAINLFKNNTKKVIENRINTLKGLIN